MLISPPSSPDLSPKLQTYLKIRYFYLLSSHAPQTQQHSRSKMATIINTLFQSLVNAPTGLLLLLLILRNSPTSHQLPNWKIIIIIDSSLSLTFSMSLATKSINSTTSMSPNCFQLFFLPMPLPTLPWSLSPHLH